ncbi:MAG TPA: acyl carrier protein, partial [Actinoplanes sp.]|nr:acyl carrier protein [Actinoplanes sp.]
MPIRAGEAYVIVGELPFVLSGDSDRALRARARNLRRFLDTHGDLDVSHLAFSLAVTTAARAHRAAVVTSDRSHLARALSALAQGGSPAGTLRGVAGAGRATPVPGSDRHPDSSAWLAARTYVAGATVDWAAVFAGRDVRPVDLPTPAPVSERYWLAELATPRRADPSATTSEPDEDPEQPAGALRERLSHLPAAARRGALLDVVRTLAAEVLEHDAPRNEPGERSFQQLGFDSLTAVEFRDRLGTATGVTLSATAIFDHPSPAALAD